MWEKDNNNNRERTRAEEWDKKGGGGGARQEVQVNSLLRLYKELVDVISMPLGTIISLIKMATQKDLQEPNQRVFRRRIRIHESLSNNRNSEWSKLMKEIFIIDISGLLSRIPLLVILGQRSNNSKN